MKRDRQWTRTLAGGVAAAVAVVLLGCTIARAAPPLGKGGGGGGGEADGTSTRFSVVELPLDGQAVAVSDPDVSGMVTIAVESSGSGAYAMVDRNTRAVMATGFLPEPTYVDPYDGWSSPVDANIAGYIAGVVPNPDNPSHNQAILWFPDDAAYDFRLLLGLPGHSNSSASAMNSWGDVVGGSWDHGDINSAAAVMWHVETNVPVDLNTEVTAAQGWRLVQATDINNDGLIVGWGFLGDARLGYVLDPLTDSIWAIPLVGPATGNSGWCINASGRVAGHAFDGEAIYYGTNPDYVQAFSWDGPGSAPVILPSVTNNTSHAFNMNDSGATVGNSYIQTDDWLALNSVPTLWEPDEQGNIVVTELASAIPDKPSYRLERARGVNNDGWIGVSSRKFEKGKYTYPALLLIPNK